ncbi:ATP-binding protein [Deinococcus apachensis]|uniref:ATP-binding protein n=1 Tax=Deinococcus apachensis TaxID=309886 RepID=UPI0003A06CD7|nr:AAA family ATPase [Deinococcus apachensis]
MNTDAPVLPDLSSVLPAGLAPLVGREADLDRLRQALRDGGERLVTLTGPGGIGKTRCAAELLRQLAPEFEGGAWVVALDGVQDARFVPDAVAAVLGLRVAGDATAAVLDALRDRQGLLLLDNFEHVLGAVPFVAALLRGAPRMHLLVTSRVPLHLSRELEIPLAPLGVPASHDLHEVGRSAAGRLFAERARRASPGFALTAANAGSVARLVRALGGLPLALELAAARLRVLPLDAVLARLNLALLASGTHDVPPRHRTLRATLQWSHDLLPPEAREVFARLGVFPANFDLDAFEAVAGGAADALDVLTALVEHGLVVRDRDRFALTPPVREAAAVLTGDLTPVDRGRTLLVAAAMAHVQGEFPVTYTLARDAHALLPPGAPPLLRMRALTLWGMGASFTSLEPALPILHRAVEVAQTSGDPWAVGLAHTALGRHLANQGEREAGVAHLERGLAAYRGELEFGWVRGDRAGGDAPAPGRGGARARPAVRGTHPCPGSGGRGGGGLRPRGTLRHLRAARLRDRRAVEGGGGSAVGQRGHPAHSEPSGGPRRAAGTGPGGAGNPQVYRARPGRPGADR